jgi:hypothetical protein
MSNFDDQMAKAIQRGAQRGTDREAAERAKQMSEEELRQLHTKYRLKFSEQIENCMRRLPQHFPGFQFETTYGERGWGAACSRDDFSPGDGGRRGNSYTRLEMSIRPYSSLGVVELTGKATIKNREVFSRSHFQLIPEVDEGSYAQRIDAWVLEFAEVYAARR